MITDLFYAAVRFVNELTEEMINKREDYLRKQLEIESDKFKKYMAAQKKT